MKSLRSCGSTCPRNSLDFHVIFIVTVYLSVISEDYFEIVLHFLNQFATNTSTMAAMITFIPSVCEMITFMKKFPKIWNQIRLVNQKKKIKRTRRTNSDNHPSLMVKSSEERVNSNWITYVDDINGMIISFYVQIQTIFISTSAIELLTIDEISESLIEMFSLIAFLSFIGE